LINILFALALLGTFAVVGMRVFRLSMLTAGKSAAQHEQSLRLGQALSTMSGDVWQASRIEVPSPTQARLGSVEWKVEGDGLVRVTDNDRRAWNQIPLRFELRDGALAVRLGERRVAVFETGGRP
jgi:hypothetical protein